MAYEAFTTDRRAFLAAAPALALITAGPALAFSAPSTEWRLAVSKWRGMVATYSAHPYCSATTDTPDYARLEQEAAILSDKESFALDGVMETRAPNHAALIEKLEIIKAELGDDFYIDCLIADVRKLMGAM